VPLDDFWGERGFGIARDRWHLIYVWGGGALLRRPAWLKYALVALWNGFVCGVLHIHDTIGPWDDDELLFVDGIITKTYPKTCTSCSKRWWKWARKRPERNTTSWQPSDDSAPAPSPPPQA
jgi:hypothetical protein